MKDKSRITGLDAFLTSTEKRTDSINSSRNDPLVMINFQVPSSLKKKINIYCIENEISMKDFLTELINTKLNKE
jgi:hypothetical protein